MAENDCFWSSLEFFSNCLLKKRAVALGADLQHLLMLQPINLNSVTPLSTSLFLSCFAHAMVKEITAAAHWAVIFLYIK